MVEYHIVRRTAASTTGVNTAVACDLPIDSTAATAIVSPGGVIKRIVFCLVRTGAEVASESIVTSVRLSGGAVQGGAQDFCFGGQTNGATSTASAQFIPSEVRDVNISLNLNLALTVQVFWNGVDIGTPMGQVELVIEA